MVTVPYDLMTPILIARVPNSLKPSSPMSAGWALTGRDDYITPQTILSNCTNLPLS